MTDLPPIAAHTDRITIYCEPGWYRDYAPGLWQAHSDFVILWRGRFIHLPATDAEPGMVLDMYSIPFWIRWKWPKNRGQGNKPAMAHDATRRFWRILGLSVLESDQLFLDAMRAVGMREAGLFYAAVRLQGMTRGAPGDGTPPRDVRRAMADRGDCWRKYAVRVERANLKNN